MRVAYLFAGVLHQEDEHHWPKCNEDYDIDYQVLTNLMPEETRKLDTLVRAGGWGFAFNRRDYRDHEEAVKTLVVPLFVGGDGHIAKANERLIELAASPEIASVYTVQFMSIPQSLALALHERLDSQVNYLGYVQVLFNIPLHRAMFGMSGPFYQIEHGKIFVLYSSNTEDEGYAEAAIDYWIDKYDPDLLSSFINNLATRDFGKRYTLLDANEGMWNEGGLQEAVLSLADMWEVHAEHALYKLQDYVPKAQVEFLAALEILNRPDLTEAHSAHAAVSFRRTLEEITRQYCPGDKEPKGWVKARWEAFAVERRPALSEYADVIAYEAIGLDDALGRLKSVYTMGNKGVHYDWEPKVFRSVALRMVLLINDLMMLRAIKPSIRPNRSWLQLEA